MVEPFSIEGLPTLAPDRAPKVNVVSAGQGASQGAGAASYGGAYERTTTRNGSDCSTAACADQTTG